VILWHRACADTARQRLINRLNRYVAKEIFSEKTAEILRHAIQVTDSDDHAATADLVIESVVEDYATKSTLLGRFDDLMRPDSILVTNTSSFSIDRLGKELDNTRNFAGLHFFNPATKMELVEIVAGENTSTATVEAL
jgi:3-hydroxybutyryl-CoA dehydrogenase